MGGGDTREILFSNKYKKYHINNKQISYDEMFWKKNQLKWQLSEWRPSEHGVPKDSRQNSILSNSDENF